MNEYERTKLERERQQKSVNFAKELLLKHSLLMDFQKLTAQGTEVFPTGHNCPWRITKSVREHYKDNRGSFVFKLMDLSIFTLYVQCGKKEVERFSFGYCSCPEYDEAWLLDNQPTEVLDRAQGIEVPAQNSEDTLLRGYLEPLFPGKSSLVDSIVALSKNPISIRCDYDSGKDTDQHPRYHLTINFIEDSRFKIDSEFSYFDFVLFVLDLVYGIKLAEGAQFVHLTTKGYRG